MGRKETNQTNKSNKITFACSWESSSFQVKELCTRKLEALPSAYTHHKQSYISLIMSKKNNVSE